MSVRIALDGLLDEDGAESLRTLLIQDPGFRLIRSMLQLRGADLQDLADALTEVFMARPQQHLQFMKMIIKVQGHHQPDPRIPTLLLLTADAVCHEGRR